MTSDRISIALSVVVAVLMMGLATAPELTTTQSVVLVVLSPAVLVMHLLERSYLRLSAQKRASKVRR